MCSPTKYKRVVFTALCLLLSGCGASNQNLINDADRNIKINTLLNQSDPILSVAQNKRVIGMGTQKINIEELVRRELDNTKANPPKPQKSSFIGNLVNLRLQANPSLSNRKNTSSILNSKTGVKTERTIAFSDICWRLEGFMYSKKYYFTKKYLEQILNEEAAKAEFKGSQNYFEYVKQQSKGTFSQANMARQNLQMTIGAEYFNALDEIIAISEALYNLSDHSTKISTFLNSISNSDFQEAHVIIIKKAKEGVLNDSKGMDSLTRDIRNLYKMYTPSYLASNVGIKDKLYKMYFSYLPQSVVSKRDNEITSVTKKLIDFMTANGIDSGVDVIEQHGEDALIINMFDVAIFSTGKVHVHAEKYTTNSNSCLEAGVHILSDVLTQPNPNEKYVKNQKIAYNIGVMQKLNCEETNNFSVFMNYFK